MNWRKDDRWRQDKPRSVSPETLERERAWHAAKLAEMRAEREVLERAKPTPFPEMVGWIARAA